MTALAAEITACGLCEGMNKPGETEAAPGYGSVRSPVVIVGQSLCQQCMETQEPFTGGSGALLNDSLKIAGIAKKNAFITNVVHCHPPGNRTSRAHEKKNCSRYLHQELEIIRPRLVIGLGRDAEVALKAFYPDARGLQWPFRVPHATGPEAASSPDLLFAPHPSWIKRQHDDSIEEQYVTRLARALEWGFRDRPRPGR